MRNGMQSMSENEYSDSYNNMLHKGKVVKYEEKNRDGLKYILHKKDIKAA